MSNKLFSSLPRKERFWAYVGTVLLAAVVLVFAIYAAIIIQERIQQSNDDASMQRSGSARPTFNNGNDLNPPSMWSNTNGASTATNPTAPLTTPLPEPSIFSTNSN